MEVASIFIWMVLTLWRLRVYNPPIVNKVDKVNANLLTSGYTA